MFHYVDNYYLFLNKKKQQESKQKAQGTLMSSLSPFQFRIGKWHS